MGRFIEGSDRVQATLFPECLEDWICEDNPVRAPLPPKIQSASATPTAASSGPIPKAHGSILTGIQFSGHSGA